MAGIQAYAQLFPNNNAVDYSSQFLKTASHFAAFAGHSLQHHESGLLRFQDLVQEFRNKLYAFLYPLSNVAAGMENV